MKNRSTLQELEAQLKETQLRLEEAEETLRAIQNNEVDALVIEGPEGQQVFTLQSADLPYRTLMETMSEGALTVTAGGTILYCNSHFSVLIGMPLNKIIGASIYDFVLDGQRLDAMLHESGTVYRREEFFLRAAHGEKTPVSLSARSLMLNDVEAFCIVTTDLADQIRAREAVQESRDQLEEKVAERTAELTRANLRLQKEIIDRKSAEEALRESEERYRNLVKYAPAVIYEMDLQGTKFLSVNDTMCATLGFSREELFSIKPVDLLDEESRSLFRERTRKKLAGETIDETIEYRIQRKDGEWIYAVINVGAYPYSNDKAARVTVIGYDITERKLAEDALREARNELENRVRERTAELSDAYETLRRETDERKKAEEHLVRIQKLEALGTLAGGIAHDFNNILAGVIGFTEMVLEDMNPDGPEYKRLELVLKGANRGRDLVKQILSFSRQNVQDRKVVALNQSVEEGLKLLRPTLPSTIEIVSTRSTDDDMILADPSQIHQILMNLCTNAAHAMREKGGKLMISVLEASLTEGNPLLFSGMKPGKYVVLKVSDTGSGMDATTLKKIFDPFFTTKQPGEGTGLGLSVVLGIVQSHGGYVTVESEAGRGATFQVYLPKTREHKSAEDEGPPAEIRGKEHILFVDDEDILVELNEQRLSRLGYDVVGTTSSMDALDIFRKAPDTFDLVVTDYTMPNMTGVDLATELLKIKSTIPIILCTGHSETITPARAKKAGIRKFLIKPLEKKELTEAIRRILDEGRGPH
jgi:PAS domain S-box-containing protein